MKGFISQLEDFFLNQGQKVEENEMNDNNNTRHRWKMMLV